MAAAPDTDVVAGVTDVTDTSGSLGGAGSAPPPHGQGLSHFTPRVVSEEGFEA